MFLRPGQHSRYGDSLRSARSVVRSPKGAGDFLFSISVQTGHEAHSVSFPMAQGFFAGGKAAEAWP